MFNLNTSLMKIVSLIASIVVLLIAAYFFVLDFRFTFDFNHILYRSILLILMLICIVGLMINIPLLMIERKKMDAYLNVLSKKKFIKKQYQILKFREQNYITTNPHT